MSLAQTEDYRMRADLCLLDYELQEHMNECSKMVTDEISFLI